MCPVSDSVRGRAGVRSQVCKYTVQDAFCHVMVFLETWLCVKCLNQEIHRNAQNHHVPHLFTGPIYKEEVLLVFKLLMGITMCLLFTSVHIVNLSCEIKRECLYLPLFAHYQKMEP